MGNDNDIDNTTWGNQFNPGDIDLRTKQLYLKTLKAINIFSVILILLCCIVVLFLASWFFYKSDYERVIFEDGTTATCVYNPKTGEVKQNVN